MLAGLVDSLLPPLGVVCGPVRVFPGEDDGDALELAGLGGVVAFHRDPQVDGQVAAERPAVPVGKHDPLTGQHHDELRGIRSEEELAEDLRHRPVLDLLAEQNLTGEVRGRQILRGVDRRGTENQHGPGGGAACGKCHRIRSAE